MRVGISLTSSYRVDDPRDGARWMIERAAAARDAGLDALFVGDHHATGPQAYYQSVPIMGRLLAEWGDRPAGVLALLPLWHPVLLAEQVATLATIHTGPFVLITAVGRDDHAFPAMGVDARHRPSRFEECLDAMRRLWAGETVSGTRRYEFTDARIAPLPPEPIEVWIGATAEAAMDRAARLGDGWIGDARSTPDEAGREAARYLELCAQYRRAPGPVAIRRDVYVGESDEEAERVAMPIIDGGYRGGFDPEWLTYGSPETVAGVFENYARMGYTDIITRNLVQDQEHALASIERLGEVRERVRD